MHTTILTHFQQHDPVLHAIAQKILSQFGPIVLQPRQDLYYDLVESIISQQLSIKAADTIMKRVKNLYPDQQITPQATLTIPDEDFRAAGASGSKTRYIKNIATAVLEQQLQLDLLPTLSDQEIIAQLTQIKGIGNWTAEMFLMFSLGREDVFSFGDGGLQRAFTKLYRLDLKKDKHQASELILKWSPYRTYASRILWKSLELK